MMSEACIDQLHVISDSVYVAISAVLLVTIFVGIHRYLTFHIKYEDEGKPSTPLFIAGILYLCISFAAIATYGFEGVHQIMTCDAWSWPLFRTHVTIFCLQTYFLWITLLLRCYYVFNGTVHSLSGRTLSVFIFVLILMPSLATIMIVPHPSISILTTKVQWALSFIVFTMAVVISFGISGLFLSKLHAVYMSTVGWKEEDDYLLSTITKHTVLAVISITFSVINLITWIATAHKWGGLVLHIRNFSFLLDAYTNFVCIMLTYKVCEHQYLTLCGGIDQKCKTLCHLLSTKVSANSVASPRLRVVDSNSCTTVSTPNGFSHCAVPSGEPLAETPETSELADSDLEMLKRINSV